jgi:hypothetical protein
VRIIDNGAVSGRHDGRGLARLDWTLGDGAVRPSSNWARTTGCAGSIRPIPEANLTAILDKLAPGTSGAADRYHALPNLGHDYARAFRVVFDRLGSRPGILPTRSSWRTWRRSRR